MKNLSSKICLLFIILLSAANTLACSIEVDDNAQKNILMANAASFNDLSLSSVSALSLTNYAKNFSADPGGGRCPEYMTIEGRVSMSSSPTVFKHCSYTVTVKVKSYIGDSIPDGPIEEVTFEAPLAACSTSVSGIKIPRPIPIRIKKPVIIKPFE